jgi:hypothetical protein
MRVVAGSMKPPKTSFEIGFAVCVVSMVAATGAAVAVPARAATTSAADKNDCLQLCMSVTLMITN